MADVTFRVSEYRKAGRVPVGLSGRGSTERVELMQQWQQKIQAPCGFSPNVRRDQSVNSNNHFPFQPFIGQYHRSET
jgi:hypothetical protein